MNIPMNNIFSKKNTLASSFSFARTTMYAACTAIFIFVVFAGIVIAPALAQAIEISLKPATTIHVGDTAIVDIFLNTEGEEINAVEGKIILDGNYDIAALSTAGSPFTLWPNKPSFIDNTISFTGGSTSGISGPKIKVFSIALTPTTDEAIAVSFQNVSAFKNDGAGTKEIVLGSASTIFIETAGAQTQNDLAQLIISDKTPPAIFEITIGQDAQTFDGKYFASFLATDAESGVNRYEVSENDSAPVRAGSPYVLQDQTLSGTLTIRAIDNAGNVRTISVNTKRAATPHTELPTHILKICLVLILILVAVVVCVKKYFRKK